MFFRWLCRAARGLIILNWLTVAAVLSVNGVSKNVATVVFSLYRISAVCALVYLIYESSLLVDRRTKVSGIIVDALLVLPMFLFWFAVSAATF
jgi:sugar phosphate permease